MRAAIMTAALVGGFLSAVELRAEAAGPAFSCDQVADGSIEDLVCLDAGLSDLDRQLASVYGQVQAIAVNEQPPRLEAEQRGWIRGRNECWKSEDKRTCVESEYRHRIAELQARYRLIGSNGPVFFICDDQAAKEVVVTFFETEPATLIAEYGDSVSLMFVQPSASGTKYEGRNETYWEHQGEAMITWGFDAPTMNCRPRER